MKKQFSEIIYIEMQEPDGWLRFSRNLVDLLDKGHTSLIGIYELKEVKRVSLKVTEEIVEES